MIKTKTIKNPTHDGRERCSIVLAHYHCAWEQALAHGNSPLRFCPKTQPSWWKNSENRAHSHNSFWTMLRCIMFCGNRKPRSQFLRSWFLSETKWNGVFPDDSITWRRQVQMFKGYRLGSVLTKDIASELLQSPMDLPSAGVLVVFFKSLWGFNKIEEKPFLRAS